MIDTDKYEGHQVSELKTAVAGPSHSWVTHQHKYGAKDFMFVNHATAALITDAPLLLAEIKRLRKVLKLFEQGFRLEDWLGIYHKDVLREWCDYLGIPEVDE